MRIVEFDEENVAYAVGLGKELVAAGTFGTTGPEFDWGYTMEGTRFLMGLDRYYLRLAYDDDDNAVGFVAGHIQQFYFSPKFAAYEDAWFVRAGTRRRTVIAVALMRGFIDWAYERGALFVQTGDIAAINSLAVDSIYKHMGFKRFGSVYKYAREG